jgi:hypothetical protein
VIDLWLLRGSVVQVLHTGIVLKKPPKGSDGRPQTGDVARLASGRLVARCRVGFWDGTVAYGCRDYDPGETPDTAPSCVLPVDWSGWIDREMQRFPGLYQRLGPTDFVPECQLEFTKFRREWPNVAAVMGLDAAQVKVTLLDVGEVWYPAPGRVFDQRSSAWWQPRVGLGARNVNWRRFADQHAAGVFGVYGQYDPAPLTEEELWTLAEQPILAANKAAIAAGAGPIRSRFVLVELPEESRLAVVDVVTVLSPKIRPRTLMVTDAVEAPSGLEVRAPALAGARVG